MEQKTVFDMIGGEKTFKILVDTFYSKVEADPKLVEIFPNDLEPGKRWQYLFLMQYFGGPTTYMEERGHPRLRMRHAPYPIDNDAKDRWLQYMLEAIDEVDIQDPARQIMRDYFQRAAEFMMNRFQP